MKICLFAILCSLHSLFSCQSGRNPQLQGRWKMEKVDIMKGPELRKRIDTGYQFWNIYSAKGIDIFERAAFQNRLHIRVHDKRIESFDSLTGVVQDEFVIESLNRNHLELSSTKYIDSTEYSIIYYLNKVEDTASAY